MKPSLHIASQIINPLLDKSFLKLIMIYKLKKLKNESERDGNASSYVK